MLEDKIDALIVALNANTAALGAKPAAVAAPKSAKAAKAPAKSEEEIVATAVAKNAAVEEAKDDEVKPEQVKAALDKLLKANKRDEAIDLLATFNGAKNVTGVVAEGQEAMQSFIDKADEILIAE